MLSAKQAADVKQEVLLGQLLELGVVLEGHFDFGNGYHGTTYLTAHPLLDNPFQIMKFAGELQSLLTSDVQEEVDIVVGPITGGALLANDLAILIDGQRKPGKKKVRLAPVYKMNGKLALREHYRKLISGEVDGSLKGLNVVIVDDVCNTGHTLRETQELVEQCGGYVLASLVLYDRLTTEKQVVDYSFLAQVAADPKLVKAEECLCKRVHIPITHF